MNEKRAKPEALAATAGNYAGLLADIKQRIRAAQVRTAMAGNASMLTLYWQIGGVLAERQKKAGWGAAVLPRLAVDLHNDLPEVKGFSARNLKLMTQFFREYPDFSAIGQPPVAQLTKQPDADKIRPRSMAKWPASPSNFQIWQRAVAQLPWAHNIILIQKVKDLYAGKMNFYLNAVDDRLKHATDQPSIGLILCEDKNKVVAEYALRGMDKAIGVSAYQLTRALPKKLQSALPSISLLDKELSQTKHSKPAAAAPKERKSK